MNTTTERKAATEAYTSLSEANRIIFQSILEMAVLLLKAKTTNNDKS